MAKLGQIKGVFADTITEEYAFDITVKMRPLPNPDFDAFMARKQRGKRQRFRHDDKNDEEMMQLLKEATAATVIVGWDNLEDVDGSPILFSHEKALEFFNDPAMYDFYSFVRTTAAERTKFVQQDEEDASKNSLTASNGS